MPAENWTVAKRMIELTECASWIRKMFEEGMRLAAIHGRDKIYDLSIGNPNVEPPEEFRRVLQEVACETWPGRHGYMQNAGYTEAREAVAAYLTTDQGIDVGCDHVIMTVGAGGALNVIFRTILDPGDEVIIAKPYFVEYGNYLSNHFGVLVPVASADDFDLDLDAIEKAIRPATRAVLVNSPNNPTGRIYPASTLAALGDLLRRKTKEMGRIIYLISDEPYRRIVFDGNRVPPVLAAYENTLIATSYSKELSLAGERIGYVAANPAIEGIDQLVAGLILANRVLGFINAPALMQRVVARLQGVEVDVTLYQENRDRLYEALTEVGYEIFKPQGSFYMFPKSPLEDDLAFSAELMEQLVLVTPGVGFGSPGFFRIAYCVEKRVVEGALPVLCEVGAKYLKR
jgi:aspartate aminotransferase